jgi:hypothetical protein
LTRTQESEEERRVERKQEGKLHTKPFQQFLTFFQCIICLFIDERASKQRLKNGMFRGSHTPRAEAAAVSMFDKVLLN